NLGHDRRRDRAGLLGPGGEDLSQHRLVSAQLGVALLDWSEILDNSLRYRLLEVAVAGALELGFDRGRVVASTGDRIDVDQVGDAGLLGSPPHLAARIGDGAAELLADRSGLVEDEHGAVLGAAGGRHLPLRLL